RLSLSALTCDPIDQARLAMIPTMSSTESSTAIRSGRRKCLSMRPEIARKIVATMTAPKRRTTTWRNSHTSRTPPVIPTTIRTRLTYWASSLSGASFMRRQRTSAHCGSKGWLSRWPTFNNFDEAAEPGVRLVTVHHAVVDGQGHIGHRVNEHRVAAVHGSDDDAL